MNASRLATLQRRHAAQQIEKAEIVNDRGKVQENVVEAPTEDEVLQRLAKVGDIPEIGRGRTNQAWMVRLGKPLYVG